MSESEKGKAVLYDGNRCIGCRACSVACKSWNKNSADKESDNGVEITGGIEGKTQLSARTFTFMRYREIGDGDDLHWAFAKIQCMHCLNPACETACIVGALRRDEETGAVLYNQAKCIGCRYCMVACPFGIPTYQWDRPSPWIRKCTFCADRQNGGLSPACVTACPTGALKIFDERQQAIEEAHRRIEASPDKYVDRVYGENEAGGTSWMYISPVDFQDLDFPNVTNESVPRNARKAMGALPYYAAGVIVLMAGAYWYTKRRQKIAAGEHEKKEG